MNRHEPRGEPNARDFRIGGISIAVRSPDAPLAEESLPAYQAFVVRHGAAPADLTITLVLGDPSLPPAARPLFEAGSCCAIHERDGELLVIPHVESASALPDWLAMVGADRRQVQVVCGPPMLVGTRGGTRLFSPFHYPLDQILLSLVLAGDGLIVHAAGIEAGAGGVLLAGVSGAGKTTLSRLCAEAGLRVLSDDRVIVRRSTEGWSLFGTPWHGEGTFAEARRIPLRGAFFLVKGQENRVRRLSAVEFAKRLIPLASVPWYDRSAAARCLDLSSEIVAGIPAFDFTFRPESGAVQALEDALG